MTGFVFCIFPAIVIAMYFNKFISAYLLGVMANCVCILRNLVQLICGGNGKMFLYSKKIISAYLWR